MRSMKFFPSAEIPHMELSQPVECASKQLDVQLLRCPDAACDGAVTVEVKPA